MSAFLVGVRLRATALAEDYRVEDLELHVGDLVVVDVPGGSVVGEVRRAKRPLPAQGRDREYRRVLRLADDAEVRAYHDQRGREERAIATCQRMAQGRGLPLKVVDIEMFPAARRVTVYFSAEERVDFRELVRDLAREFRSRIDMRQIGARDTTKMLDGIGPCGRRLCCAAHLRRFEPISVKMAKAQDMPLTDNRPLGSCGRLKCCLLYEFSTYQELGATLPKVNTACEARCGGRMAAGKVKALRLLKQAVVLGFPDGSEAEVPVAELSWVKRPPVGPATEDT